jgi:4-hydroxy-3-methylbut-2-enyl diphosphate reductase
MKITIAKTAGFCMGVRRAVDMALDAPRKYQSPIYTYGPLIHNPQVLALFAEKGISVLNEIPATGHGTVLIRAHGVPPETKPRLEAAGFQVIDATCPRVIRVQTIIRVHARKGYATIIVGDRDHPEVVGLLGYAAPAGHVVASLAELMALPRLPKAIIVAQTTQNKTLFESIKAWAKENCSEYEIFDTICGSTGKRQAEIKSLAECVDAVVVVGGKSSGNTQRLAEIVRQSGKPAFHVETEAQLDYQALATAPHIGITAGASTPNWIIKRVYRALEQLPLKHRPGWQKLLFSIQCALLLTNIYLAFGAASLFYACIQLIGGHNFLPQGLISMLYVLSMHIFNHLTSSAEDRFNDPERAKFYKDHKWFLTVLALIGGALGLLAAISMGIIPFLILLAMSLTGLSYNLKAIPWYRAGRLTYVRLRDFSGSKTILIAAAWGVVTALLPALAETGRLNIQTGLIFLWSTGIVFSRTLLFDILDMQGDRIVGKETIPILLGAKRSIGLFKAVLAATFGLLTLASAIGLVTSLGYALAVCPVFLFAVIHAYEEGYLLPGIRLEFLVETVFVLAGVLALVWSFFY